MRSERGLESKTGGRAATTGVIPGDVAISVGNPNTDLPEGWNWRLLSDLARLETGHTPSRSHPEYWGGSVPWVGIRDATANHGKTIFGTAQYTNELGIRNSSARILPANTVCLSRTASVGFVVVMGVPMATSQDFVNWVCGPELDHRYLKYILLAERSSFLRFSSGTTHQTIYFPEVKAFHVALPSLSVQQRIADVLAELDDRIDLLSQMNTTLESIARATFKSWFIDFEPVLAKSEGAVPTGMDESTAAHFPTGFESSAIGSIPAGWRVGKLGDVCTNPRDQAKPGAIPPDTPYIGLEHMPKRSIALEDAGTAEGLESGKFWFEREDVLFGKLRPYFHKVGLAPCAGVCSTDILVLRPTEPKWLGFLAMHASSDELIAYATQLSNGARMPRTSWQDVAAFRVAIPPERIAEAFNYMVEPLFQRISANIEAAKLLMGVRDTLLPRLIGGKLRLPECQEELREMIT